MSFLFCFPEKTMVVCCWRHYVPSPVVYLSVVAGTTRTAYVHATNTRLSNVWYDMTNCDAHQYVNIIIILGTPY